jgi:hypothetical protein
MLLKTVQSSCTEIADTAHLMILPWSSSVELGWSDLAQDRDKVFIKCKESVG